MKNRVVITGLGIYSCIGTDLGTVRESLYNGKSGIGIDPERKAFGYSSALTGILPQPNLKQLLDRRSRNCLAEQDAYAYMATRDALLQAGLDEDYLKKYEAGIIYGNDSSSEPVIEAIDIIREKHNTTLTGSGSIFKSMNSTVTMNLSVIFSLRGISFTVSGACASGSHAIGLASVLIREGLQDCIVTGGAQEVNKYSVASFDGLSAFSKREDAPTEASRPFDKSRDGLVPSGGAATVVLESEESAKRRGAHIIAEVLGYGFSSNGESISLPGEDGPVRSLQMALRESGLRASDIRYINAHATSTPAGDWSEAKAIDRVFQCSKPYVTSTKSMTGHEMWMAGASEVVYSLLMMQNGFIAPNLNFEEPDDASAPLNIPAKKIEYTFDTFLSNSFGFGGTNSSLIIRNYKP